MKRSQNNRIYGIGLLVATTVALSGCNLEGQSVEGGISGTGFIIGPLELESSARSLTSNPDSVTIRGRTFDTSSASFNVPEGLTELADGMLVRVDGNWDSAASGNATRLVYNDTLRGPVSDSTIDSRGVGTLTVAGQTVEITSDTAIAGDATRTELQGLNSGSIRVSGWRSSGSGDSESIRASWIYYSDDDDEFADIEVEGAINSLSGNSFSIGGLTVNFDTSVVEDDLTLEDGIRVEVEGALNDSGELVASEIERDDAYRLYRGDDDDDTEIEGPIATLSAVSGESSGSMTVNGIEVTWSSLSVFDDELTHDQLRVGLPVEVEGTWRGGKLVAEEIELGDGLAEISGQISGIDGQELTIGGITVDVPGFARITDDDNDDQTLQLSELSVGDYVEAEGIYQENGDDTPTIEALVIERENESDDEFELRAPIAGITGSQSSGTITVLGITIAWNAGDVFDDHSFNDIDVGDILEISYSRSTNNWVAEKIEKDD